MLHTGRIYEPYVTLSLTLIELFGSAKEVSLKHDGSCGTTQTIHCAGCRGALEGQRGSLPPTPSHSPTLLLLTVPCSFLIILILFLPLTSSGH